MSESKGGLLAALTRRAADFIKFAVKTTPVAADVLLIEDSANSGTKAYATAGTIAQTVLTSSAPIDITKAAAVIGDATSAARANHKHDISTAVATAITPGDSAIEGDATSLARSNHKHSLPAYGTSSGTFCQGNDSRLSNARTPTAHAATHQNGGGDEIATAAAGANSIPKTGATTTLDIGWIPTGTTSTTVCIGNDSRLSDDRVASGLRTATTVVSVSGSTAPTVGQHLVATSGTAATWQTVAGTTFIRGEITGTSTVTTTSTSDVVFGAPAAPDMTVTPAAGTYMVWFSGELTESNNARVVTASIYSGGLINTASERIFANSNSSDTTPFCCTAIVTVNGAQAIEGRWRVSANTATNTRRSLMYLKVA